MFVMPEVLPTGVEELAVLHAQALAAFDEIRATVESGTRLDDDTLAYLENLVAGIASIEGAQVTAQAAVDERDAKVADLLRAVTATEDDTDAEEDTDDITDADDVTDPAPVEVIDVEPVTEPEKVPVTASSGAKRPVSYRGLGKTPQVPARTGGKNPDIGWLMDPQAPGYTPGLVDFATLAAGLDSVRPGARVRSNRPTTGTYSGLTLGKLARGLKEISDPHELFAEINRATALDQWRAPQFAKDGSLTAAGGWCAPSETLYDFCGVPSATDLVSLPDLTINRGGVRWPNEPDLSEIFASFEWFFTEAQLEAVDGNGNPTAIKNCVEIPCPEDFTELRLNAVGYCVEAGILQTQGWPELIRWFMESLVQEHLRAMSRRTIADMVSGSTALAVSPGTTISVTSAILNSVALMATNLRLDKGLGRTALIEGVAPSWIFEVMRADIAMREGISELSISDAQLNSMFSARNVALQLVGDWQTRSADQPGNIATMHWPSTVDILLYPAGTWFRSLSNVIELGVMYPKELLQVNRYTRMFTEDAIVVGKRCNKSLNVTVPICVSGAIGQREYVVCNSPTAVNETQRITITGTPTGGTFALTFNGQTASAVARNASAANVVTALEALSNIAPGDVSATGGPLPGTPVDVTFAGAYEGVNVPMMTADGSGLTGGTDPAVTITTVTQGHS